MFKYKVVAAMKQPMEADVSGGTAEAVFEETLSACHFLLEMMGRVPIFVDLTMAYKVFVY
jgi:hypothetical protein